MFESFKEEPKQEKRKKARKTSGGSDWMLVAGITVLVIAMALFFSLWINTSSKFQNQKQETQIIKGEFQQAQTDWGKERKTFTAENSKLEQKVENLESVKTELEQENDQLQAEKGRIEADFKDMEQTAMRRAKQFQEARVKNNKLSIELEDAQIDRDSYEKLYEDLTTQIEEIYKQIIENQKKEISRLAQAYKNLTSKTDKKK